MQFNINFKNKIRTRNCEKDQGSPTSNSPSVICVSGAVHSDWPSLHTNGHAERFVDTDLTFFFDKISINHSEKHFFMYYLSSAVCVCGYVGSLDVSYTVQPATLKLWHNIPHVTS